LRSSPPSTASSSAASNDTGQRVAVEVLGVADVQVVATMAVHGANVPWGQLTADGVIVGPARQVPDLLQVLPAILGPERVAWLADRARLRFHAARRVHKLDMACELSVRFTMAR
jgi:hypothetical protein